MQRPRIWKLPAGWHCHLNTALGEQLAGLSLQLRLGGDPEFQATHKPKVMEANRLEAFTVFVTLCIHFIEIGNNTISLAAYSTAGTLCQRELKPVYNLRESRRGGLDKIPPFQILTKPWYGTSGDSVILKPNFQCRGLSIFSTVREQSLHTTNKDSGSQNK